jgi:hypothetical protein
MIWWVRANKRRYAMVAVLAWMSVLAGGCGGSGLAMERAALRVRQPDSGITGNVLIGPTCPVERPGKTCERPYGTSITIRLETTHRLVDRVRSSAQGRFRIALTPSTYLLQPESGHPYPRSSSQVATVHSHRYTAVLIRYDSGIR